MRRRREDPDVELWAIFAAVPLLFVAPTGGPRPAEDALAAATPGPLVGAERGRFSGAFTLGTEVVPLPDGALVRADTGDLRLDWRGPAGATVAALGVRDGRVTALSPTDGQRWAAPYADAVVRAATGGRLEIADAVALWIGDLSTFGRPDDVRWQGDVVVARWDDVEVVVDPRAGRPRSGRLRGVDGDLLRVSWTFEQGDRPSEATIDVPRWQAAFRARFDRWQPADVDADVFVVGGPRRLAADR